MTSPIVGGLLAFLVGGAVSALNYRLNLLVLRNKPAQLANMSFVRQILSVACLVAAFLLGKVLPWGQVPTLIGAALGLTVPAFFFAFRLAKLNDAASEKADKSSEKGADEPNG